MTNLSKDQLATWLATVQDYPVTEDNSVRLLGLLDNAKHTINVVKEGTLFWTEPAGLITTFADTKRKESDK